MASNKTWDLGKGNRYRMDGAATRAALASTQMRRVAKHAAERGKAAAEASAPVRSGEYRRSFEIRDSTGWDGRAGVDLVNTSGHAAAVEFGVHGRAGRHVLGSVIDLIEG